MYGDAAPAGLVAVSVQPESASAAEGHTSTTRPASSAPLTQASLPVLDVADALVRPRLHGLADDVDPEPSVENIRAGAGEELVEQRLARFLERTAEVGPDRPVAERLTVARDHERRPRP